MGMSGYLKDQENNSSQDRRTLKMEHLTYLKTYAQFKKKKLNFQRKLTSC